MVRLRRYLALLGGFAVERGVELWVSARNTRRAIAAGAVEHGRGHYTWMVGMHSLFLPACAVEAWLRRDQPQTPRRRALAWIGLGGALAGQALRWWAVRTLGPRWSTRVLRWPSASPVDGGPYRWLRHPNYAAVALEMACVPLAGGCVYTAILFSLLDAAVLAVRITVEERALGATYANTFRDRRRFLPRLSAVPR